MIFKLSHLAILIVYLTKPWWFPLTTLIKS
jgi:hypothetical protein